MDSLVKRELMLALQNRSQWVMGIVFFGLFLSLCAVALGGELKQLRPLAGALIWLAVLFSMLLAFNSLFQDDYADGTLEQLVLSGIGTHNIVISKMIAFFISTFIPLLIATPLAGISLGLPGENIAGICLSLLFAAPALTAYGVLTGALLAGHQKTSFYSLILTVPFLIPVLIFGLAAIDSYSLSGLNSVAFQALIGLGLIGLAIAVPASAAALSANLE